MAFYTPIDKTPTYSDTNINPFNDMAFPDWSDGDIVCIFDLESKRMLSRFRPVLLQSYPAFKFDVSKINLHLIYKEYDFEHRYSADGTFLDESELGTLTRGYRSSYKFSGYKIIKIASAKLTRLSGTELNTYAEVIDYYKKGIQKGVSTYAEACAHRSLGEIYFRCNDTANALRHFERALQFAAKMGIKKLIKALKSNASM